MTFPNSAARVHHAAALPTPTWFVDWLEAVYTRHTRELTFQELRRGLQALSRIYVNARGGLDEGKALDGAGKRAAFAAFYAPVHALLALHVLQALGAPRRGRVVDLGCGTGAVGAMWARHGECAVLGIDQSGWALGEAAWTYAALGVQGRTRRADLARARLEPHEHVVAAYAVNELAEPARHRLLDALLAPGRTGCALVLEPIARAPVPWWPQWEQAFVAAGGQAHEWRVTTELPERLASLDRAAGLHHGVLKGRTLWRAP